MDLDPRVLACLVAAIAATWAPAAADDLPELDRLWDFGNPAASEARFREVLPRAEAAGDADYLARLLTQVARAQGLQQRFSDAHATLDRAEKALPKDGARARALYLLERGRVHNSAKEPDKARPLFETALDVAEKGKADDLAVDAAHMLGIVEKGDRASLWTEKAIALAERSEDPKAKRWLGSLYNNLAWTRFDQKRYADSLAWQERALAHYEQRRIAGAVQTARWSIAKVKRHLGRVEEALAEQRRLLAEHEAAKEEDGFVYEEIAECLLALGKGEEARPWFRRAHEALGKDAFLARDEPERLARLERLGRDASTSK